jgi:hypothetical protein
MVVKSPREVSPQEHNLRLQKTVSNGSVGEGHLSPLLIMTRYSNNKDIQKLVCQLIKHNWKFQRRKKHGSIFLPAGKRFTVPSTPSDKRAFQNFSKDIQRSL